MQRVLDGQPVKQFNDGPQEVEIEKSTTPTDDEYHTLLHCLRLESGKTGQQVSEESRGGEQRTQLPLSPGASL